MKSFFKLVAAIMIVCCMFCLNTLAAQYKFPSKFWPAEAAYKEALEANNYQLIAETGLAVIDSIKDQPDNESTISVRASHYEKICIAYEMMGKYAESAKLLPTAIKYAQMLDWKDVEFVEKAKLRQYLPVLDLYSPSDSMLLNFGAKNEPLMGVLHGANMESEEISSSNMSIFYISFGDRTMFPLLKTYLPTAERQRLSVEIALNVAKEGNGLTEVLNSYDYIAELCSIMAQSPDLPIYLRFGAEMNVWSTPADPDLFISAFRFVSDTVRSLCDNVAVVWSVNSASGYMEDMNKYYPGDQYVDWVGISAYASKYFLGQKQSNIEKMNINDAVFYTGNAANLDIAIAEVIEKYGSRKPIMIAEGGVSHTIQSLQGLDETAWALAELRRACNYIPMLYPQVKLMAYFDVVRPSEPNNYALLSNLAIKTEYERLMKLPHFIQGNCDDKSKVSYTKTLDTIHCNADTVLIPLCTYVHTYGVSEPVIEYYLDGNLLDYKTQIPYSIDLRAASLSPGAHDLKVIASAGGIILAEKQYTILKSADSFPTSLKLNGNLLSDAKAPFIYMNKTLVPVRILSEKMNYSVKWDGAQKLVTVSNNNTIIEMIIDSYTAYINGNPVYLESPAKLIDGTTFVPIRFIAEATNSKVDWDGTTKTVLITKN